MQRPVIIILACLVAILLTPANANTAQAPARGALAIPGVANETPEARRLAMERWEFVDRLAREAHFYLSKTLESVDTALFPIGRSDRVYLLCLGPFSNEPNDREAQDYPTNEILCYQRKNGRDKLVYKLPIINVLSPPTKTYPPKSLLEYINSQDMGESYVIGNQSIDADGSLAIECPITIYEYNDLSAHRDYVEYRLVPPIFCIDVYLLSDTTSGDWPSKKEEIGLGLGQDPKETMTSDKFYPRYGLPVIKEEEALMESGKGETK
ncbi:MAG TPA: hypothetical protein VFW40_04495 [Capsulimonadaceae bacterium]|nr:hypothetical protein [Capsulimonadaceae bacterium]